VTPTEPNADPAPDTIRPLKEVWLRPRRVFRALAARPLSFTDYALVSAVGIANCLASYGSQSAEVRRGMGEVLLNSLIFGPILGIASTFLFAGICARLGLRVSGSSSRTAMFHVSAYGGIPVVAAFGVWGLAIMLVGNATLVAPPMQELDGFQTLILLLELLASGFLGLWSVTLQVMGLSELLQVPIRKAVQIWLLGRLLWIIALLMFVLVVAILFPGLLPAAKT
jgi:hypothetical protein